LASQFLVFPHNLLAMMGSGDAPERTDLSAQPCSLVLYMRLNDRSA
jgi:hypothetical protein